MKIEKKGGYTLITVAEMPTLNALKKCQVSKKEHLVIQFCDNVKITTREIISFLPIAKRYKKNSLSFVVVCSKIDVDELPEYFMVVPTLVEAEDIIAMEDIERNLNL